MQPPPLTCHAAGQKSIFNGTIGEINYSVRSDLTKVLDDGSVAFNEESWCDIEDKKNYTIAITSFLARGNSFGTSNSNFIQNQSSVKPSLAKLFNQTGDHSLPSSSLTLAQHCGVP